MAKLYTDITRNGYKILYLTSRAIGQADATRGYLRGIEQGGYQLPEGPVIMSPDRLMASLHRLVVTYLPMLFDDLMQLSGRWCYENQKFSRWLVCGISNDFSGKERSLSTLDLAIASPMHYHIEV